MASGGKKKVRLNVFWITVLQHRPCVVHVVRDKPVPHKFVSTSVQLWLLHTLKQRWSYDQGELRHPTPKYSVLDFVDYILDFAHRKTGINTEMCREVDFLPRVYFLWFVISIVSFILYSKYTVKTHMKEPSGLRTCWQKFAILKPKNIRTY